MLLPLPLPGEDPRWSSPLCLLTEPRTCDLGLPRLSEICKHLSGCYQNSEKENMTQRPCETPQLTLALGQSACPTSSLPACRRGFRSRRILITATDSSELATTQIPRTCQLPAHCCRLCR